MLGLFQNWNKTNIEAIQKMVPDIEPISIMSQLAKININNIKEDLLEPLLEDTKLAIISFELGANTNIVEKFYDLTKFDGLSRFRLVMCSILYHDLIEGKITTENEWSLLMNEYSQAWTPRFKLFWELGYQFDEELSNSEPQPTPSALNMCSQLIKQINQQTHILLANGLVEER